MQEVARSAGLDRAVAGAVERQRAPQLRDVHLDGLAGGRRGRLPPEIGDQPLGRDHRVRAQQEERQQGWLPQRSERDRPVAVEDLQGPQDGTSRT